MWLNNFRILDVAGKLFSKPLKHSEHCLYTVRTVLFSFITAKLDSQEHKGITKQTVFHFTLTASHCKAAHWVLKAPPRLSLSVVERSSKTSRTWFAASTRTTNMVAHNYISHNPYVIKALLYRTGEKPNSSTGFLLGFFLPTVSPGSQNTLSSLIFTSAPLAHIITASCLPETLPINSVLYSRHTVCVPNQGG